MRSLANLWKLASVAATSALLFIGTPAQAEVLDESPNPATIVADAALVRPLYFALSQVGTVVYTATLPFTLLAGNPDQVAETIVVTPLQGAFLRCLGCGKIDNDVRLLSELDGSKKIKHFVRLDGGVSSVKVNKKSDTSANFGVHAGTHFSLVDGSRFDLSLGAMRLGSAEAKGVFKDTINSYQIANRFGRQLGNSSFDLMFKFGGHYYETKRDPKVGKSTTRDGFGLLGGVGVDSWITENTRLGLDYTYYRMNKLPSEYGKYIGTYDLSLSFMF